MDRILSEIRVPLRTRVVCPHCWNNFAPEDTLWVAAHPELQEDPQLGDEQGRRFLPTRFDVAGNAIDSRGAVCRELACPHCHLRVPRPLFEMTPLFVSIAGTPSCGKTYFLSSMTWRLRRIMPKYFAMTFTDADPVSNLMLNEYENLQFFNSNPDQPIKLEKTQEHGHLYDTVMYGDELVEYPRPFLFALCPGEIHPNYQHTKRISRLVCLYDNAGESFEPGKDEATAPVTRHLAQSQVLMFCFDPTQDPRFRKDCRAQSEDPQVVAQLETRRQEAVFHEMVDRVRKHAGLSQDQKYGRPLVIIVTKCDVWWRMCAKQKLKPPWTKVQNGDHCALDMTTINDTSDKVRGLLWQYSPEIVGAAEAFAERVIYVPVSATGCSPEYDAETGCILGVRPRDINPMWAEVPLLVALARWGGGMIAYRKNGTSDGDGRARRGVAKEMDYRYPPAS